MTTASFQLHSNASEAFISRSLKLSVVLGLHGALVVWITHVQFDVPLAHAPIVPEVRTIQIMLPPTQTAQLAIKPVSEPKVQAQATRAVSRRPSPTALQPLQAAAPSIVHAPATLDVSPQMHVTSKVPEAPAPSVSPTPVLVTAARFDANYLQNPAPPYPAMSRKLHEEGRVLLHVKVTASGTAEHVEIKQGSGYSRLDEVALNTVRQWRFVPARRGDEAIVASVLVPIVFKLDS